MRTRALLLFSVLTVVIAGCRDKPPSGDPGPGSRVLIRAAEGGLIVADDRLFALFLPPGALAEDTEIAIKAVQPGTAPAAAAGAIGDVYQITPSDLALLAPATALHRVTRPPAALRDGETISTADHAQLDAAGSIAKSPKVTVFGFRDGSVGVAASIFRLSTHWLEAPTDAVVTTVPQSEVTLSQGQPLALMPLTLTSSAPRTFEVSPVFATSRALGAPEGLRAIAPRAGLAHSLPEDPELLRGGGFLFGYDRQQWATVFGAPETLEIGLTASVHPNQWLVVDTGEGEVVDKIVLGYTVIDTDAGRHYVSVCEVPVRKVPAEREALIFLGSNRNCTSTRACDPVAGAVANVVVADDATTAGCERIGAVRLCAGVSLYRSVLGPDVSIETDRASITATRNPTTGQYDLAGVTGEDPFGAGGTMRVRGTPLSVPDVVQRIEVPAPSGAVTADEIFGERNGLETPVSFPMDVDGLYFFAEADGPDGPATLTRVVLAADATLTGDRFEVPMLDPETIAELVRRRLTLDRIRIAVMNFDPSTFLFPGVRVLVIAAQALTVPAAEFYPTTPGGDLDARCDSTPVDVVESEVIGGGSYVATFVACIDPTSGCRLLSNTLEDVPRLPTQCAGPNRAFRGDFDAAGVPEVSAMSPWFVAYADAPHHITADSVSVDTTRDTTIILERSTDRARYRVVLRPTATGYTIREFAPYAGTIPSWGALHSCEVPPARTFSSPTPGVTGPQYLRVCLYPLTGFCAMAGNLEASPEPDECNAGFDFTFAATDTGVAFVRMTGGSWTVESSTSGTINPSRIQVTGLPPGADVTLVFNDGAGRRYSAVVQYTGAGYILQSWLRL